MFFFESLVVSYQNTQFAKSSKDRKKAKCRAERALACIFL
jgi:hypothetical protein